ncbi:DMT family transporter [Nocardioides caldifontis]|uniref:DMT family transporter n=1 Tax=Nocardioides caldifontis TaxID=2588938 RepID=UPI0011DF1472|nr:EamA family transporter [Nocardioides caldifontis]
MGPALCLLSAALFGAMAIFGKLAYDADVTPQELVLVRFTIAAALLWLLHAVSRDRRSLRPGTTIDGSAVRNWRPVVTALGLGAFGYALQASLFFSALDRVDAPMVSLVLYTYPALVTVAAVLLGRERLSGPRVAALVAASAGTLLVLVGAGAVGFEAAGVAFAFGAALTYTVYILVADTTVHQLHPIPLSALVMTGAAAALALRAALTGGVRLDFESAGWLWIAFIAVVSTVGAMLAFFAGLKLVGPSTASILSAFEPVTTTVLAAVTLGELLTPVQLVGGILVLASVALVQLRPRGRTATLEVVREPARAA